MGKVKSTIVFSLMLLILIPFLGSKPALGLIIQNDANSGADAPDSSINAINLSFDTMYTGEIGDELLNIDNEADNHDYYSITTTAIGYLSISYQVTSIINTSLSTISIHNGLKTIGAETFWEDDPKMFLVVPLIVIDTYVIVVNSYSDYVKYEFKITFTEGSYSQNDAGTNSDTSIFSAPTVILDTAYTGEIGYGEVTSTGAADLIDYYKIVLPSEGYLNVKSTLTTDDSYEDLSIYVETDAFHTIYSESLGFFDVFLDFTSPIPKAGDYYIELSSHSWNSSYTLELSFTSDTLPSQNDANLGGDASEDFIDAPIVGVNTTISGMVGEGLIEISDDARDNTDTYKLDAVNYGRLEVKLTILTSEESYPGLFVNVYNHSDIFQFSMMGFYVSQFTPTDNESIVLMPGSDYFLDIDTFDKNVTYELTIVYYDLPYTPPADPTTTTPTTTTPTTTTPTTTTPTTTTPTSSDTTSTNSLGVIVLLSYFSLISIIIRKRKR